MIISWDCDDVLFELCEPLLGWHNQKYGTKTVPEDVQSFELHNIWGCTKKDVDRRLDEFWSSSSAKSLPPIQGVHDALNALHMHEHLVNTSRNPILHDLTRASLDAHYNGIFKNLVFSRNHHRKYDGPAKSEICRTHGATVHIDDSLTHAKDCAKEKIRVLLLDKPWNQGEKISGVIRIYSPKEILDYVQAQLF